MSALARVGITALLLASWQSGTAEESDISFAENHVKSSIAEEAAYYICSDQRMLNSNNVGVERCVIGVATFADSCWALIDKLVSDYELPATEQGEESYGSISDVFIVCVQAKLFLAWASREEQE